MSHSNPRQLALHTLALVLDKQQPLDVALQPVYASHASTQDKALARQLVMCCLRRHGQLSAWLKPYLHKALPNKLREVERILWLGLAQLWLLDMPAYAVIDTSVQLCKKRGFRHQSGLVNAVLRKAATAEKPDTQAHLQCNLPEWLHRSWRDAYGEAICEQIIEAVMAEPPLDLQFKPEIALPDIGGNAYPLYPHMLRSSNRNVSEIDGYEDGHFWVQDVAASLPVRALNHLLGGLAGKSVLDACAAPGGKTMQLASYGATVTALDISAERLRRVQENVQRTGLDAACIEADLRHWQPDQSFDAIVLDAPCSATGTIRRHPDMLHRKQPKDVEEMVALQRAILSQCMTWLQPDIPVLYCTCSLQPEEGEQQIGWLHQQGNIRLIPIDTAQLGWPEQWQTDEGMIRTLPHYLGEQGGMDGFFIAAFVRC